MGIPCSAATPQMLLMMRAGKAQISLPNQVGPLILTRSSNTLMTPNLGLKIQSHDSETATAAVTLDKQKTVRNNPKPRIFWFRSKARHNPSTKFRGTLSR